MKYQVEITDKMRAVHELMLERFVGMGYCISEHGENLILEVPRGDMEAVVASLKENYRDVVLIRKAYEMIDDLHDFILIKPLVSEAPLELMSGLVCPSLEKRLVDMASDKEFSNLSETQIKQAFQRAFEVYGLNTSRMLRYAGRKGEKAEIASLIEAVDDDRIRTVRQIQDYLSGQPVDRAWMFGSFSRMEERPDSDIDLLITLRRGSGMGLLGYSSMALELEGLLSRKVDLVTEGSLKPFALESVNKDKVLIYERA